jgi:hypothetical protein
MDENNNVPPIAIEQMQSPIKPITSVDQITKIIKRKDITYASHYRIPSLKRDIPFNEINTSQQKRLVKSVIDSPIYNTEFIYTFREILRENCQDITIDIDRLTIIDKLILALALRARSIGPTVEVEVETKKGPKVNVELDITKILSIALDTIANVPAYMAEDAYFKVECSVPTIGTEYSLEKELRNNSTEIEIESLDELRKTVGEAYISEIVKYISNVYVKDDDNLIPINWNQFKFADRIKVIEAFKASLLKDIISYINQIRIEMDKIELVNFEFDGEKYERRLTIDGSFFTIS